MGISWTGLVGNAMSGGAQGAASAQDFQDKQALAQQMSDLEVSRDQLAAQRAVDMQNQQRVQMVGRINAAKSGLVNSAVSNTFGGADANIAAAANGADPDTGQPMDPNDQAALTPDQQAVISQNLPQAKAALANQVNNDPQTTINAGILTGDISPSVLANLTSKSDIAELKGQFMTQAWRDKFDTLQAMSADKNASFQDRTNALVQMQQMRDDIKLQMANDKLAANPKIDTATGRMLITSLDRDLGFHQSSISQLQQSLLTTPSADRPGVQATIAQHQADIQDIMSQKKDFFRAMGTPGAPGSNAAPVAVDPDLAAIAQNMKASGLTSSDVTLAGRGKGTVNLDAQGNPTFTPTFTNVSPGARPALSTFNR